MRSRRLGTQFLQAPEMTRSLFKLTLAQSRLRQLAQRFGIVGMEGESLPQLLTGFLNLARCESCPA